MRGFRFRPENRSAPGSAVVAVYAWLYAMSLGLVVLDGVYARQLRAELDSAVTASIFSEISDFLLFPSALLILSGLLALVVAWRVIPVRLLVLVSLLLPLASLLMLALFGPAIESAGFGPATRLLINALGSVLAMLGMMRLSAEPGDLRTQPTVA